MVNTAMQCDGVTYSTGSTQCWELATYMVTGHTSEDSLKVGLACDKHMPHRIRRVIAACGGLAHIEMLSD